MPGGGGRTETKHDLVGGTHTVPHCCFPCGDAGLDAAQARWVLGSCLPHGRFDRNGMHGALMALGLWGSGPGTRELQLWEDVAGQGEPLAWTSTKGF